MTIDETRRDIPRTDAVLADPRLAKAQAQLGRRLVHDIVSDVQSRARAGEIAPSSVIEAAVAALPTTATSMRRVVNATGVLVHTNLGRAPLSAAARTAIAAADGTTDVEFDLSTGERDRRGRGTLAALAAAVPDAEDVHVVNNNAAALLLCALTLAAGKEILISRGELVEIGDGFRIPELLASTGAQLREVGTTNRTTLADYAAAISDRSGFVLKVHPSNFVVRGFTSQVAIRDLAQLGIPVVADIGSGLLHPHPLLPDEPDATTALRDGARLVTASGDKLLGGPQAGLLLGNRDLIQRLRRHPAARALRVDKLTLAALEATLRGPKPPVVVALERDVSELRERASRIADIAARRGIDATAVPCQATVGGGGAPGVQLPSAAVSLPEEFAAALRTGPTAVVGRVEKGRCLLDLRSVLPDDDDAIAAALAKLTPGGD